MIKVARLTVVVVAVLMVALGGARLVGRAQANPLALWLTNPDGSACSQACLFGITPGITSYSDAVQILAEHPATRQMQRLQTVNLVPNTDEAWGNGEFCISLRAFGANVSEITVSPDQCYYPTPHGPLYLTLGQVMVMLGRPDDVELGAYFSGNAYFASGKFVFEFAPDPCGISPALSYSALSLLDTDFRHDRTAYWKGFSSRSYNIQTLTAASVVASCHR